MRKHGERWMAWRWLCMALPLLLAACTRDAGGDIGPAAIDPDYVGGEQQWRLERARALQADDGWTTLVGLHWLELRAHYIGNGPRAGIDLGIGPPRLALVQQEAGEVYLTSERGVALTVNGEPLKGRVRLHPDRDEAPTRIGFDDGRGELGLIERGGRHALRVRHLDAPARSRFAGLRFWSPDPSWRMQATWVPHPPGQTVDIVNIVGQVDAMPNPGAVEFDRDGQSWRLEAVDGGDGLVLDGRRLYVVRQWAGEVVALDLSPDFATATEVKRISPSELAWPATAAIRGDRLIVANSQLNRRDAGDPEPFSLISIPLSAFD